MKPLNGSVKARKDENMGSGSSPMHLTRSDMAALAGAGLSETQLNGHRVL